MEPALANREIRRAHEEADHAGRIHRLARAERAVPEGGLQTRVAALLRESDTEELTDAAYRYCRHEPGVHVVLCGTGDPAHLEANVRSALRPPLPLAYRARLAALFGRVVGVTGS